MEVGWVSDQRLPGGDSLRIIRRDTKKPICAYLDDVLPKESSLDSPQEIAVEFHDLKREEEWRRKGGRRSLAWLYVFKKPVDHTRTHIMVMCPHLDGCGLLERGRDPSRKKD